MVDNARQNSSLNHRRVAKETALAELFFLIISEIRKMFLPQQATCCAAGPEGNHGGNLSFNLCPIAYDFGKETIIQKSSLTRQINIPRKT
jgi:hypothetical protein